MRRAYGEEANKNNDNIVATLCIDMIGNPGPDFRGTEVVLVNGNKHSSLLTGFAINVNQRYSEFINFTIFRDDPEGHFNDYLEFSDEDGYDSLFFAEDVDDEDWHKTFRYH